MMAEWGCPHGFLVLRSGTASRGVHSLRWRFSQQAGREGGSTMQSIFSTVEDLVAHDTCPKCRAALKEWLCTGCGFDALGIAMSAPRKQEDAQSRQSR